MAVQPPNQISVGILIRVSTKKQGEYGASLETQRADCAAYCEHQGWRVALVEEDHQTGTDFDRTGYQRLLAAAKEGRIQGVVVRDLSRFGRGDLGATIAEFEEFRTAGCLVASANENIVLQPTDFLAGRLDVGLHVLFNSYRSWEIAKNVHPNMARRVSEGKWVSGAPFGLRVIPAPDGRGRTLEPQADMAWAVPELFKMADEGQPETALVAFARKHGLRSSRTPPGRTLSRTSIRRILENPVYIGKVVWNRRGNGRFRPKGKRPDNEIIVAEGLHPALVDEETFNRVQARLKERRTYKTYTKRNVFLLDGLVYCAKCDAKMRGSSHTTKGRQYRYYYCTNRHDLYSCDQPRVSADRVDEQVRALIEETFSVPNVTLEAAYETLDKRRNSLREGFAQLRIRLERRRDELKGKLDKLLSESMNEGHSPARIASIERLLQGCEEELEAVQHELRSLRPEDEQLRDIDEAVGWLEGFGRAERVFKNEGREQGAAKMRYLIEKTAKRREAHDPAAWQRVARQFIHRLEIEGRLGDGRVRIEWSSTAQSILHEEEEVLKLTRTVPPSPGASSAVRRS